MQYIRTFTFRTIFGRGIGTAGRGGRLVHHMHPRLAFFKDILTRYIFIFVYLVLTHIVKQIFIHRVESKIIDFMRKI